MRGGPALLLLAILAGAGPAAAGVFRCVRPDGSIRFADSPHACGEDEAEAHTPPDRLVRAPAAPVQATEVGPELDGLWLSAAEAGSGWEVVRELPGDPSRDPDLVAWGVRAQDTRHYSRHAGGSSQVCSVEIWAFHDAARARAAHEGFAYPNWEIHREGALLVMLRAVTLAPGQAPHRSVFADCRRLGERIRARARPTTPAR